MSLSKILSPIQEELKLFEKEFKHSLRSEVSILNVITSYLVRTKGKRIRPSILFLTAGLNGEISKHTYLGATMIELLHSATLLHDDVVDHSEKRRGFFTINALWKNKVAVLIGDYFLSKGLLLSLQNQKYNYLEIVSNSVQRMSEGELLQISTLKKINLDEDRYYRIISGKTASLFEASCKIGAASVTSDEVRINQMALFGFYFGMSFQITDDVLDFIGEEKIMGKKGASDFKDKKITLPLLYALQCAEKKTQKEIIKIIYQKNPSKKDEQKVIQFAIDMGGIDYAQKTVEEYNKKSLEILALYPNSKYKDALICLLSFVISRKK